MESCKEILLSKNINQVIYNRETRVAMHKLMTRNIYRNMERSAALSFDSFFGSYDKYERIQYSELNRYDYKMSETEALSILNIEGLSGATQAWTECMRAKSKYGLYGYLDTGSILSTEFVFRLVWRAPIIAKDRQLKNVEFIFHESENEEDLMKASSIKKYNDKTEEKFLESLSNPIISPIVDVINESIEGKRFTLQRSSNRHSVTGIINAQLTSGTGQNDPIEDFSWEFFIPKFKGLAPSPYFLSNIDLIEESGNIYGELQFDTVYWQDDIIINNEVVPKGISMHAPDNGKAWASFRIPPFSKWFKTRFGIAAQTGNSTAGAYARGNIYIDDVKVYTGTISGSGWEDVNIPIHPEMEIIKFEVDSLGRYWSDHTTWGNARFE